MEKLYEEVLEMVTKDGMLLKHVENQTDEICLAAVKSNPVALKYVKNQTEQICLEAIKRSISTLKCVKDQTANICLTAIRYSSLALEYINNQTDEICLKSVSINPNTLRYVNNQTEEICLKAVSLDPDTLRFVNNQTEEICLKAVSLDPYTLRYVDNQTEQICLEAIKKKKDAIKYVNPEIKEAIERKSSRKDDEQSKGLLADKYYNYEYNKILESVKFAKNDITLRHHSNKFKDYNLCLEAVKANPNNFLYVPEKHRDTKLCLEVVKSFVDCMHDNERAGCFDIDTLEKLLFLVPEHVRTADFISDVMDITNSCGDFIYYMAEEDITRDLCLKALDNDALLYCIPQKFIDYELCKKVLEIGNEGISDIEEYAPEEVYNKIKDELNNSL